MRHLILMRGVPASGKSTFIKKSMLEPYTLSSDKIRLMLQAPVTNPDGSIGISQKNNKQVFELLFSLLEQRMKRGDYTVVDATHISASSINAYRDLCDRYRYKCIVVDFSLDYTSIEEIIRRNSKREKYQFVPENVIRGMADKIKSAKVPSWVDHVDKDNFPVREIASDPVYGCPTEEAVVFGDIHGCYEPIKTFFEEYPFSEDKTYIFLGDLFDRGIQNGEVADFILEMIDKPNVIVLEGNHERWLAEYSFSPEIPSNLPQDFRFKTLPALEERGWTKKSTRQFCRKLKTHLHMILGKKVYHFSHGGFPTIPSLKTSTDSLIRGVGGYKDSEDVDNYFASTYGKYEFYSIHGHRNVHNVPIRNTHYTFNLCGTPELGGAMRVLILREGKEPIGLEIQNNVYDPALAPKQGVNATH